MPPFFKEEKMAEVIPENYVLLPNRLLIQETEEGSCIADVIKESNGAWGSFVGDFSLQKTFGPEEPDPENPEPAITVNYTRIIFKREGAQEVQIDEEDYLIIHCNDVLAFIPPEE